MEISGDIELSVWESVAVADSLSIYIDPLLIEESEALSVADALLISMAPWVGFIRFTSEAMAMALLADEIVSSAKLEDEDLTEAIFDDEDLEN